MLVKHYLYKENNMKYRHNCCVVIWIALLLEQFVSAEIYSSTSHIMDELSKIRKDNTLSILKQLIDSQEQRLKSIRRFVDTLEQLEGDMKDPEFTVYHPLDAYRFIKNHLVGFNDTVTDLVNEIKMFEGEQDEIGKLTGKLTSFQRDDLLGAILGFLRIQHVYDLQTGDLADGNIRGLYRPKMTALECRDMMSVAFHSDLVDQALEWLEVGLQRIEDGDDTITYTKILCKAAAVAFNAKYELTSAMLYEYVLERNPKSRYHQHKMKYYRGYNTNDVVSYRIRNDPFRKACQMSVANKDRIRREHVCVYVDNGHPLLRYQPAKVEILSLDPYITVYHDCFNVDHLSKLMALAKPHIIVRTQLTIFVASYRKIFFTPGQTFFFSTGHLYIKRSTVGDRTTTSHFRTSKGAFLSKTGYLLKLCKYVEALTTLRHESFENFQVANYGIGGHYETHVDFNNSDGKIHQGNKRLATFMIYMTDVEEGGATVFPELDVSILPAAGKAVFWYNLYPDGTGNWRTNHGACPVISGDKWVGNIWIREQGQEFTKPCNLDKNDVMWK